MSLQSCLEKIRCQPTPENEESAKFRIIAPILRNLGWHAEDGSEVLFEHPVGGKKGGRVDIVLKTEDKIVALIEAKHPSADLSKHVSQVLGYAFYEGVDICVLTSGLEWWLFLPREQGRPMQRRFTVFNIFDDPLVQLAEDLAAFLDRESLARGQAVKKAKAVLDATRVADHLSREIPAIWNKMLGEPDEELVELISKRSYEQLSLRPSKEQVKAVLFGQRVPPEQPPVAPSKGSRSRSLAKPPSRKPIAIEIWGQHHPVSSYKQILCTFAEILFVKHAHDFDRALVIRGRKRPLVARDAADITQQTTSHRISASPYYIETNFSAEATMNQIERLLKVFGYDSRDLKVIFNERR